METWQIEHINKVLPDLIKLTKCNIDVYADLRSAGILSDLEKEEIELKGTSKDKAYYFYEVVQTKTGGYFAILRTLNKALQSGAVALLLRAIPIDKIKNLQIKFLNKVQKLSDMFTTEQIEKIVTSLPAELSVEEYIDLVTNWDIVVPLVKDTVPPPYQLYIPRVLRKRVSVSPNVFTTNSPDTFVFESTDETALKNKLGNVVIKSSASQLKKMTARFILLGMKGDWDYLKETAACPLHLICYDPKSLTFILWDTKNESTILQEHLISDANDSFEFRTDETKLYRKITSQEHFYGLCISGSQGMGKSLTLANLARLASVENNDKIVVFTNLERLAKILDEEKQKSVLTKYDLTTTRVITRLVTGTKFTAHVLYELLTARKVLIELILDSLNEAPKQHIDAVISFIVQLQKEIPTTKTFLTSRKNLSGKQQKELHVLQYYMEPFSKEQRTEFFSKFWSTPIQNNPSPDIEKLETFIKTALSKLNIKRGDQGRMVSGVPLQCMLIAEVLADDVNNFTNPNQNGKIDENIFSIYHFELYQRFFKLKFGTFDCHWHCMYSNTASSSLCEEPCKALYVHVSLGLKRLFPEFAVQLGRNLESTIVAENRILSNRVVNNSFEVQYGFDTLTQCSFTEYLIVCFVGYFFTFNQENSDIRIQAWNLLCEKLQILCDYGNSSQFTHSAINYFLNLLLIWEEMFTNTQKSLHLSMLTTSSEKIAKLHCTLVANKCSGLKKLVMDIFQNLSRTEDSSCIAALQEGSILVNNLLEEQRRTANLALVNLTSGTRPFLDKPAIRGPFMLCCTGNYCNPRQVYEWACKKCLTELEYGFDQFVYCDCGKTPLGCLEFCCLDPNHGLYFETHQEENLPQLLSTLRPFSEINILILGETGVGKSTFINGFINFLKYNSLEEAEAGELCTFIPSEFTVCDENFHEILVRTGTDDNEVMKVGQSTTQTAKVYSATIGHTTIRLIDTPGITDTRGIEQDKKSFQTILGTLSHFEKIHGICILLKPNNSRLTVMFRFCVKELLTHLHKDASKNIMFCFTNSRGTFYRPGDTMFALKNLLSQHKDVEIPINKNTVYCFDSEAYLFLAAVKNDPPVSFSDSERSNFSTSWETSLTEIIRMLKHIRDIKSHKIKNTLNLNTSRELVIKLCRPLCEICRNIQINKALIGREIEEIENMEDDIKELRKNLMRTQTNLEARKIDHPKTVCSHTDCKSFRNCDGIVVVDYTTVCHSPCACVRSSVGNTLGHPDLMKCSAMSGNGFCRHMNCGHSYRQHLHIFYDTVQVQLQVEDVTVARRLKEIANAKEMKQNIIKCRQREISEYEEELQTIENSTVKFAHFVKRNAITPYNDAVLQYFEHLIEEEQNKVASGADRKTLEYLTKSKASYVEQIRILNETMEKAAGESQSPLGPGEIEQLVKMLEKLKHFGGALKQALSCVDNARNVAYKETDILASNFPTTSTNQTHKTVLGAKLKSFFGL